MSVQFSGYQVSLLQACSTSSPTPYSRFAVRYVHGFCLMLPSNTPFLDMPLPCWRCPSVRYRRIFMFPVYKGTAVCTSCRAHLNTFALRRRVRLATKSSGPRELPPQALREPDVKVSLHPALIVQPAHRVLSSVQTVSIQQGCLLINPLQV